MPRRDSRAAVGLNLLRSQPIHAADNSKEERMIKIFFTLRLASLTLLVDDVDALDALQIALVETVDTKIARRPVGIRISSDPDLDLGGSRLLKDLPHPSIGCLLAKVVQMTVGNRRETLVSLIPKDVLHPFTKLLGGWP